MTPTEPTLNDDQADQTIKTAEVDPTILAEQKEQEAAEIERQYLNIVQKGNFIEVTVNNYLAQLKLFLLGAGFSNTYVYTQLPKRIKNFLEATIVRNNRFVLRNTSVVVTIVNTLNTLILTEVYSDVMLTENLIEATAESLTSLVVDDKFFQSVGSHCNHRVSNVNISSYAEAETEIDAMFDSYSEYLPIEDSAANSDILKDVNLLRESVKIEFLKRRYKLSAEANPEKYWAMINRTIKAMNDFFNGFVNGLRLLSFMDGGDKLARSLIQRIDLNKFAKVPEAVEG